MNQQSTYEVASANQRAGSIREPHATDHLSSTPSSFYQFAVICSVQIVRAQNERLSSAYTSSSSSIAALGLLAAVNLRNVIPE